MAKTYEELLEQAATVRDETKANANTAARVGGALADLVEFLKDSPLVKDYSPEIAAAVGEIRDDLGNNLYGWAADQDASYSPNSKTYYRGLMSAADKEKVDKLDAKFEQINKENSFIDTQIAGLKSMIVELGAFDTFSALFARAAKFDIVSNNAIALLHGTYRKTDGIYHGVLILQQVEVNNAGGGTAMQYIYIEKRQYTRYINFSATAVTEIQGVQNDGARNLSLSGRVLQMKNMWGFNVGDAVTLPDWTGQIAALQTNVSALEARIAALEAK